jgi:uncharacterized protein YndB with AHSA1/START domain
MKVQKSIEIATAPSKIWPFLVEPEKFLKWYPAEKFEYTSEQSPGIGAPFYLEEKGPMGMMKFNYEVTELAENKRLAFKMKSGNFAKSDEQSCTLEAIPSGCRFTFEEDFEFPYGIFGKIMGLFGRLSLQSHVKKMQYKLKGLAEK